MHVRQIKWLPLLMAVTIIGIAAFQVYWLQKTYEREQHTLEKSSNITFRETVHRLQAAKLKLDGMRPDSFAGVPAANSNPANRSEISRGEVFSHGHLSQHNAPPDDELT